MYRNDPKEEEGCHRDLMENKTKLQSLFYGAERCCELDGRYLNSGECKTTISDKVLVLYIILMSRQYLVL